MKRFFLVLTMTVLLLCTSAARADYFSATFLDNAFIFDAYALDSNHLVAMTTGGVYRANLTTNEITLLAPQLDKSNNFSDYQ